MPALGTVSSLFDAAVASPAAGAEAGTGGVRAAFREGLAQLGSRALVERVPEINAVGVEHVPTGALVRFRCMVQDMYNPEYYVGAYRDAGGRWRTTKYTEDLYPEDLGPGTHPSRRFRPLGGDACCTACPCPARARGCGAWRGAGVGAAPSTPAKTSEERAAKKDKRARDEDVEMDAGDDAAGAAEDSVAAAPVGRGAEDSVDAARAAVGAQKRRDGNRGATGRRRRRRVHPGGDASSEAR